MIINNKILTNLHGFCSISRVTNKLCKMRYLVFIILIGLFSCSKQEYVEVRYELKSNGFVTYSLNGIDYDTVNIDYTKTVIHPITKGITYDLGITIYNRGSVDLQVYVNNELRLDESLKVKGCGSMHKHFEIIYKLQ